MAGVKKKGRHHGLSIDPDVSSQSSSDLSSPNESCYSFVRNVLQVRNDSKLQVILGNILVSVFRVSYIIGTLH